ncbi:MAG TPA: hypothetical protein DDW51_07405, partial [Cyanobacteria bacterium UBA11367]|nr:hypothetical protein [Cyanobacteria bacterium UBA11367]
FKCAAAYHEKSQGKTLLAIAKRILRTPNSELRFMVCEIEINPVSSRNRVYFAHFIPVKPLRSVQ